MIDPKMNYSGWNLTVTVTHRTGQEWPQWRGDHITGTTRVLWERDRTSEVPVDLGSTVLQVDSGIMCVCVL